MLMQLSNPLGRASYFFSVIKLFLYRTFRCVIELKIIMSYFFSQTQQYFIILLIGYKFRPLDHHQAIFTRSLKQASCSAH